MLPENEDHVVWSIRIPQLGLDGVVEVLADSTYQIAVVDRDSNEWAKFLPTERDYLDAVEKLQKIVNGTVEKYVEEERRGYRSQGPSGKLL